jgi:hypothetical protein
MSIENDREYLRAKIASEETPKGAIIAAILAAAVGLALLVGVTVSVTLTVLGLVLPSALAVMRRHRNKLPIIVINAILFPILAVLVHYLTMFESVVMIYSTLMFAMLPAIGWLVILGWSLTANVDRSKHAS